MTVTDADHELAHMCFPHGALCYQIENVAVALAELRERAEKAEAERDRFRDLARRAVPWTQCCLYQASREGADKWLADAKAEGLVEDK